MRYLDEILDLTEVAGHSIWSLEVYYDNLQGYITKKDKELYANPAINYSIKI